MSETLVQEQTTTHTPLPPEAPKPKPPMIMAGGQVRAIVPQSFEEAFRIANVVHISGMAPKGFDSVEKCMVAIMHGAEVGLSPMQALQSIAIINNRPCIWGDAALALVRASGLLSKIREWEENVDGTLTAKCLVVRGNEEPVERTFSQQDAVTANLAGKDIWKGYPRRMRQMRARAWALRDVFPDVLKGLAIREEVEDYEMKDITPAREPQGSPPAAKTAPRDSGPPLSLEHLSAGPAEPAGKAAGDPSNSPDAEPAATTTKVPPAVERARRQPKPTGVHAKVSQGVEPDPFHQPAVFLREAEDRLARLQEGDGVGAAFEAIIGDLDGIIKAAEVSRGGERVDAKTVESYEGIVRSHERRLGLGG